tara:strand:+ start:515 stop:1501 length:987 start_codon:yes stop_codon:yes gene_type:complete
MRFRLYLAVFFLLFSVASNAYDRAWQYRTMVQVTNNTGTSLSNQLIELNLTDESLSADYNWSADGDDLRITMGDENESSAISFEIKSWDSSAQTARLILRLPSFPQGSSRDIYLFYGNSNASSASQSLTGGTVSGILYQSRYNQTDSDPISRLEAETLFNNAPLNSSGYGEATIQNFTNIRNSDVITNGSTRNYIMQVTANFAVTATRFYRFQAGVDFGYGGGIYIRNASGGIVQSDAVWNQTGDGLWWQNNWDSNNGVLSTIESELTAGNYSIQLIGVETYEGTENSIRYQIGQYERQLVWNGRRYVWTDVLVWDSWRPLSTSNINL